MQNEITSSRTTDMKGEKIVKRFLIKHFYQVILSEHSLKSVFGDTLKSCEYVKDTKRQVLGEDTIIHLEDGSNLIIDEKSAIKYINKRLATFAFELRYKKKNGEFDKGWFVNDELKTDKYLVMWLKARGKKDSNGEWINGDDYINIMKPSDIRSVEAYLLDKKCMRQYLEDLGLTKSVMIEKACSMSDEKTYKAIFNDEISYHNSMRLHEKPVNLLIKKTLLQKLAEHRFDITPDSITLDGELVYQEKRNKMHCG